MENRESFEYIYSAQQRSEVEAIRKKYLPKEEDKMETLRSLHQSATKKAQSAAISVGTVGALVLGTGMSLCMTPLGEALGGFGMVIGIVVGLAGMALVGLGYPLYNRVLKKQREQIAPEILRLTEELMK